MVMVKCVFVRFSLMNFGQIVTWTPEINYDDSLSVSHVPMLIDYDIKIQFKLITKRREKEKLEFTRIQSEI